MTGEGNAESLLEELVQLTATPSRRPGDITARDYAERAGCSQVTARTRLNKLVEEGLLDTEIVQDGPGRGRQVRVWRRRREQGDREGGSGPDRI